MSTKLSFEHQGKTHLFVQDTKGEIQPHPSLKGNALTEAQSVLPLAKEHFTPVIQAAVQTKTKPALSKKEKKHFEAFAKAEKSLTNAKKLKSSTLKNIEKNLEYGSLSLSCTISSARGPIRARSEVSFDDQAIQDNSVKLNALSDRLKTLSAERKDKIEKKMNPITRFFHKLAQLFKGGGWRTLAERADALQKKIEGKIILNKAYLKVNENTRFEEQLKAASRQAGGAENDAAIQKLNNMTTDEFNSKLEIFVGRSPISAVHIYPHLNEEKRKLFNEKILAQPEWASLANYHFFNEGTPIAHFDKEAFYNKFSQESVKLIASAKYCVIRSMTFAAHSITAKFAFEGSQDLLKSFQGWYSKHEHFAPKNFLSDFLKFMVAEKISKEADDSTKVILLLDELLGLPTQQKAGVEGLEIFLQSGWKEDYNQAISKFTIQDTLNRKTLTQEVIEKLEQSIECKNYHLFTA